MKLIFVHPCFIHYSRSHSAIKVAQLSQEKLILDYNPAWLLIREEIHSSKNFKNDSKDSSVKNRRLSSIFDSCWRNEVSNYCLRKFEEVVLFWGQNGVDVDTENK